MKKTLISLENLKTPCYLCNKKGLVRQFKKMGYFINRCSFCGLLSLDFKDNYDEFLKEYYQEGYFTGDKRIRAYVNYSDDKKNITKNARKIIKEIKKYKTTGTILDVGCAMGFFMEEAQKEGFQTYGVEVSQYAGNIAKKKFMEKIFIGSVEEFCQKDISTKFDIVVFSDIIEHLKDPKNVLINLQNILNPNAIIIIQTGDTDSLWAKIMKQKWHFYAPPQHLFFYSQKTITNLLNSANFRVKKIYKESKHVSFRYLLYMLPYMNFNIFSNKICNFFSDSFLGKISIPIKLFDNMVVIAEVSS